MSYHSHKLNSIPHFSIIGRTDPITGDIIKKNDVVVFCDVCQSCFLEESWVYMNEQHCEQNQTLDTIPALPSKLIVRKQSKNLLAGLETDSIRNSDSLIFPFVIIAVVFTLIFCANYPTKFLFSILSGIGISIGGFFITKTILFNFFVSAPKEDENIYLFDDRLKMQKESFYWSDIKQIKFQREMENYEIRSESKNPTLSIYFQDGTELIKNLPTKDYESIDLFLRGLAKISNFTEVFLYSEQSQEYAIIKQIKENTKGNIIVGKPFKLLADRAYSHKFKKNALQFS